MTTVQQPLPPPLTTVQNNIIEAIMTHAKTDVFIIGPIIGGVKTNMFLIGQLSGVSKRNVFIIGPIIDNNNMRDIERCF